MELKKLRVIFSESKKYIRSHNLIICGSVDDGKSSLIGKLIFELNALIKIKLLA